MVAGINGHFPAAGEIVTILAILRHRNLHECLRFDLPKIHIPSLSSIHHRIENPQIQNPNSLTSVSQKLTEGYELEIYKV